MTEHTTDNQKPQADTYPNAGRESGYVAPVGEDLVNRLTILISGIETKLLVSSQQLVSQMNAAALQQDQRFGYVLNQLSAFLEKEDARHDQFGTELTSVLAALEETRLDLGKVFTRVESVEAGVADLAGVVSDQGEEMSKITDRLILVEQTPGTSPDLAKKISYLSTRITIVGYTVGLLVLVWVLVLIATVVR